MCVIAENYRYTYMRAARKLKWDTSRRDKINIVNEEEIP